MKEQLPRRPWRVEERLSGDEQAGFIAIVSDDKDRVCDIFPFAKNGVGLEMARTIATFIVQSREGRP